MSQPNKVDLTKQFSLINLPSRGLFYSGKNKSLLIKYITAIEEHILSDQSLLESGRAIELVLNNIIIDDFNVKELLLSDFQAILIFTRSTSYGDTVDIASICPECKKEGENQFKLSSLKFKNQENEPNEDGKFCFSIPENGLDILISPTTLARELEKIESDNENDYFIYKDDGQNIKIKKEKTLSLVYNIDSINGETDKGVIRKIIKRLSKKHINELTEFINENDAGIENKISLTCQFCGEEFIQNINLGYNFISFPESYKQNILEELFLITYYGKGITREDALSMPVFERKWHIRRIHEEIEKQNAAEKAAASKAKMKGKR